MEKFSKVIRDRRLLLGLGVREVARLTDTFTVPSPIKSAIYLSRIEAGDSIYLSVDSVTIDKLWGLGQVLHFNPFELFLLSRAREDLLSLVEAQSVRTAEPIPFGDLIRDRRSVLNMSIRDAAAKATHWPISGSYWYQMETNFRDCVSKISGDKLWGIGYVLDIDPCLLYVASRGMDARFYNVDSRDRLFK